jgi:hypothetical protein
MSPCCSTGRIRRWTVLAAALVTSCASNVHAVDCNENGIDDVDDIVAATSEDCNSNRTPDECEFVPFELSVRTSSIEVGRAPRAAVTVDLNGDGLLDIAISDQTSASASKLIVVLAGGVDELAPPVEYAAGANPIAIAAGDVDADGDMDLATANFNFLEVFINTSDGSLAEALRLATPRSTRDVVLADVTGDGRADLVAVSSDQSTVTVQRSTEDGGFERLPPLPTGDSPRAVVAADFGGDGLLDLVTANRSDEDITILRNLGNAEFVTGVSYPGGGRRPSALVTGDLDLDGRPDLVVDTIEGFSVSLMGEDLIPEEPISYRARDGAPIIVDWNGDGVPDIGVGEASNTLVLFPGEGSGRFPARARRATEFPPDVVQAGDLDGDGDQDAVLISRSPGRLSVLWNRIRGSRPAATLAIEATRYNFTSEPHSATIGDVDGDGRLDFITANGGCRSVSVFPGLGNGTLEAAVTYPMPGTGHLNSITATDLDSDGDLDLAVVDNNGGDAWVLLGEEGAYGPFTSYFAGAGAFMVTHGDVDGDGALELITANSQANSVSLLFNEGKGTFSLPREVPTGSSPLAVLAEDVDRDGDLDLAVPSASGAALWVLENDGTAHFPNVSKYPTPPRPVYVAAGDFNGDGRVDLVTASNRLVASLGVFLDQGDGTFENAVVLPSSEATDTPYSVIVSELNGDGNDDLITTNELGGSVSVLLGAGDATFETHFRYMVGAGPRFSTTGDLDADGDQDLISANRQSNNVTVLLNQGNSAIAAEDFLEAICTGLDFDRITQRTSSGGAVERSGKYLVPARSVGDPAAADLLPTVFQNARRFALHQDFLAAVFPDRFASLSSQGYNDLVGRRETRDYYVGVLHRLRVETGVAYGFSVLTDTSDPGELLTVEEMRGVYETLTESFRLRPVGYFPEGTLAREVAASWEDPGFPVFLDSGPQVPYQPYTKAVGFGRIRLLDAEGFAAANARGQISFQNILILDHAPRDIEGVVGGVITAEPQGELSHVVIRTARRNTPNAFVADAASMFAPYEGELVRLEVREADFEVRAATIDEAEEFWASNRPQLMISPQVDREYGELASLGEIAAMDAAGMDAVARFGGKATNLARLQAILDGPWAEYRERGFAIPARYYLEFLRRNRLPSALTPDTDVTYEEYIHELLSSAEFQSNSEFRFEALDNLRDHMRDEGIVDSDLVGSIAARVGEVLGTPSTLRVRFRSSSNVEDDLEFNGAGLYNSTSGCAEDDADADSSGPSHCDPMREGERGITRALKRVWGSLWNFRAYEERAFFGIPQENTAMAVLVNRTFIDEAAQGVAFTGNTLNPLDERYVVTVQAGEESVVSPAPGIRAEKDLLEIEDGRVRAIIRAATSSLVEPGSVVLSDPQLEELGALMAYIDEHFPLELGDYDRSQVLLDFEFKFMPDGELAVKQVRPFLLNVDLPPTPVFALEMPRGLDVCGVFGVSGALRGVREEYEFKSRVRFHGGVVELPTRTTSFPADLIAEVLVGPEQALAAPLGEALVSVLRIPGVDEITQYRFTFEQDFVLPDRRALTLSLVTPLEFEARGEEPLGDGLRIDDDFFIVNKGFEPLQATLDGMPLIRYGSCDHESLPRWTIAFELENGVRVELEERFLEAESVFATGSASLARAEILAAERRVVTDYWNLVYSAFRHNQDVRYWIVLEPPMALPDVPSPVRVIDITAPAPGVGPNGEVRYLGVDLETLTAVAVSSYTRRALKPTSPGSFRRGDVLVDGRRNLADALHLLGFLFERGTPPDCLDAADTNDDGRINLLDAFSLLDSIFRDGDPLPEPLGTCGLDPTPDALECNRFGGCP